MKKKVLFFYNLWEREYVIIRSIENNIGDRADCYEVGFDHKDYIKEICEIRPDIIFTYPITTWIQIQIYQLCKKKFESIIITYTTEGLWDYDDNKDIETLAGLYDYSYTLIDYHVFWGRLVAKKVGEKLLRQGKANNPQRILFFGYPMYEKDVFYEEEYKSVKVILGKKYEKRVLVLTGFDFSLYTEQDIINAQDFLDVKNSSLDEIKETEEFKEKVRMIKNEEIYCKKYIELICREAGKYNNIQFIIKLHPHEIATMKHRELKYIKKLKEYENVTFICEAFPLGVILPYCNLMIHYGSTADLEAYIYHIPTLKLEDSEKIESMHIHSKRLTNSTYYESIDSASIDKYLDRIEKNEEMFITNTHTEKQLYELFNYKLGEDYHPAADIADFICSDLSSQKIKLSIKERYGLFRIMIWKIRR